MITSNTIENYPTREYVPGWVRSERYEFCDSFCEGTAMLYDLQDFFMKLFKHR